MRGLIASFALGLMVFTPQAAFADDRAVAEAFLEASANRDADAIDDLLAEDYRSLAPPEDSGLKIPEQSREEVMELLRQNFERMEEKGVETETEIVGTERTDDGLVVQSVTHSKMDGRNLTVNTSTLYRIDGEKIQATRILEMSTENGKSGNSGNE